MCNNCQAVREQANKIAEEMSSADKSREFYRRQGECRERERIIKLLEELITKRPKDWPQAKGYWFEDVIALIKGEQSE